jgi:hypothetical protein
MGTVWAGDARDYVHGGAELTRWVRGDDDVESVGALLTSSCGRVRVMPFLEGIPCSIHGVLTIDGVAALRPCEMIVLRDSAPGHFRFVGISTGWDPDDRDREQMRDVARRVGQLLRDRYDYLGTFTVDGVMTEDGFRPTELNPRVGGGLALMGEAMPETGLVMHTQFLAHNVDTGIRAVDIENVILPAADSHRTFWATELVLEPVEPVDYPIALVDGTPCLAAEDGARDGVVRIATVRSYTPSAVVMNLDAGRLPVGPSSAPLAAAGFALAQRMSGLPLGPFETARSVR